MLTLSLQSSSSLLAQLSNSSASSVSSASSKNAFDQALSGLMSSIKSGNTSDSEKYLAELQKLAPSNADSSSPLGVFLSNVTSALASDDIAAAQSALKTLQSSKASDSSSATSSSDNSGSSEISQEATDVLNLFSAISSGDVSSAQSAYDSLTSLLASSDSSATSSYSSTSTTSSTSSTDNSFDKLLSQIGSALGSGDITSAQSALDGFLQSLSAGSSVSASS